MLDYAQKTRERKKKCPSICMCTEIFDYSSSNSQPILIHFFPLTNVVRCGYFCCFLQFSWQASELELWIKKHTCRELSGEHVGRTSKSDRLLEFYIFFIFSESISSILLVFGRLREWCSKYPSTLIIRLLFLVEFYRNFILIIGFKITPVFFFKDQLYWINIDHHK